MDSALSHAPGDEAHVEEDALSSSRMRVERVEHAERPAAESVRSSVPVLRLPQVQDPAGPSGDRGRTIALAMLAGLVAIGVGLIAWTPGHGVGAPSASIALTSAEVGAAGAAATTMESGDASVSTPMVETPKAPPPRPPPVWRVASLKADANVDVVEGTFGKHGFVQALAQAGLPRAEIKKLAHAFEPTRHAMRPAPTDSFVVAKDRAKNTLVAFELAASPLDVWQVRVEHEGDAADADRTVAKKLDLWVEHKHSGGAVVFGGDLSKAVAAAGLRAEIADALGDAVEGHVEPGTVRAGLRMRIATTEDWVEGAFARVRVDAVELVPTKGAPFRVYYYERDPSAEGSHRHAPAAGFYDAKGRQPVRGAFRSPLPLARITSRYNPKRMHPVLHVVMPHNGIDFGASPGTPVYASAAGTVTTAGNSGPCGNMVEIEHTGGISTAYCHLKGFAQGLHSGQKVESHQLVGYVGATGRVTGPHLHFVAKKNGVFIDPQGLKMDGMRVLPPSDREAFAKRRTELDGLVDAIALPSAPAGSESAEPEAEPDGADDDKDVQEE